MAEARTADVLMIGLAQIAPAWLDRAQTLEKILEQIRAAARVGCQLAAFGEPLLTDYPFWVVRTDGTTFNSPSQKEIHGHCMDPLKAIQK